MGLVKEGDRGRDPERHPGERGSPRRHGLQGRRDPRTGSRRSRWTSRSAASRWRSCARALEQAREGRMHILGKMEEAHQRTARGSVAVRPAPDDPQDPCGHDRRGHRAGRKEHPPDREGQRRGGEHRGRRVGRGRGNVEGVGRQGDRKAIKRITEVPEIGKVYPATVKKVTDFGAFVEFLPGKEGLVHVSQLDMKRVENPRTSSRWATYSM